MKNLEAVFDKELHEKAACAKKECNYNPTRFIQMMAKYGGVETAHKLLSSSMSKGTLSEGYSTLCLCGRLDLTVEDSVCKAEYRSLFNRQEIEYCMRLLGKV